VSGFPAASGQCRKPPPSNECRNRADNRQSSIPFFPGVHFRFVEAETRQENSFFSAATVRRMNRREDILAMFQEIVVSPPAFWRHPFVAEFHRQNIADGFFLILSQKQPGTAFTHRQHSGMSACQIQTFTVFFNRWRKNVTTADKRPLDLAVFQIRAGQPERRLERQFLLGYGQNHSRYIADFRQDKGCGIADGIGKLVGAGKSPAMLEDFRNKGENFINIAQSCSQKDSCFFPFQIVRRYILQTGQPAAGNHFDESPGAAHRLPHDLVDQRVDIQRQFIFLPECISVRHQCRPDIARRNDRDGRLSFQLSVIRAHNFHEFQQALCAGDPGASREKSYSKIAKFRFIGACNAIKNFHSLTIR